MHRILLDTDPGIDDALALFLALASPEVQLEAITTVNGNVGVTSTTRNALSLLEFLGRTDIPVAGGSDRPLLRSHTDAAYVHGDNGLGGVQLPEPTIQPIAQHAVDAIIERILAAPGEITLVPIGPLTNIALAVRREPRIAQQVREVVIMGGALRVPGNVTPGAEFNIYVDPEAAHIVFHAGWPIRLIALDVTMQARLPRSQVRELVQSQSRVGPLIEQMLAFYFDVYAPLYGESEFHMHDPLCLAATFQPSLLKWQSVYVDVELEGKLTTGQTVAYFNQPDAPPANMQVATHVNEAAFIEMFVERVRNL